jgi:adenylate kinase
MRVAVTGTPGTGKTSSTDALARAESDGNVEVIHLNEHIETERLYSDVDETRDSLVADPDALAGWLDEREPGGGENADSERAEALVVESHLAHLLPADRIVVLRCQPEELERRLDERGVDERKMTENAESEAIDAILAETVERYSTENVYEIDTTDLTPVEVGKEIGRVIAGERAPSAGTVSFLEYFE